MSFRCAWCKGVFEKDPSISENEKIEEMRDNFGGNLINEDKVSLCDECYKMLLPEIQKTLKEVNWV